MANGFTRFKALEAAVQIVTAAAQQGGLRLNGASTNEQGSEQLAKVDGVYVATLLNTIADNITKE
ncbi:MULTISPECIES: hypothetical protein [Burkholderia cepacia complex]|uniref:hypothetical protein n=1 Tax=Burkholderia cepacia complex TaxID=87882 RepID=UPI0007533C0D|nr:MULTISPECIES: hypothetical protein [Burkholderia cepacia complex]KVQ43736.1 hypothetical protein WK03_17750 [Burkholderia cepacia]UTV55778.1 hypothetical protein NLX30_05185 [Burkholderia arboris]